MILSFSLSILLVMDAYPFYHPVARPSGSGLRVVPKIAETFGEMRSSTHHRAVGGWGSVPLHRQASNDP
jgi:hypothetical protein